MSRRLDRRLCFVGALLWLLASVAVFTLDGPLARFDISHIPGDLRRLVNLSEVFAHGMGVGLILVTLWVLDRDRRLFLPRVALLTFAAGGLSRVCKFLVSRQRPLAFDLQHATSASFHGIPGHLHNWAFESFPSGHTATAVGLALALSSLYPRGRGLFVGLAVLAASQRVLSGSHFLSDTLAGAGIACFVAAMLRGRLLWDARSLADR